MFRVSTEETLAKGVLFDTDRKLSSSSKDFTRLTLRVSVSVSVEYTGEFTWKCSSANSAEGNDQKLKINLVWP